MINLLFHQNNRPLFKYPITKTKIVIGRDSSADIVLSNNAVSRLHCYICKKGENYFVKSLGTNPTYVNGNIIKEYKITEDSEIRIADWIITLGFGKSLQEETTLIQDADATKIISFDESKKIITTGALEITAKLSNGKTKKRTFKKNVVKIGSASNTDFSIENDGYISKTHCKLSIVNNDLFLTDLGSTNCTIYEGEKIDKIALPNHAKFTIGKTEVSVKRIEEKEELETPQNPNFSNMVGSSKSIKEIFALISRVAPTEATVCITGESGTGKELVAESIHKLSNRKKKPFVAINCGAIPANIIESELFGHEKGAFTGAIQTHRGVFEQADTGTLFLDEIGEMPADLQTRLLRVLETRKIRRIGGQRDIPVDVRIVAATNQDLKQNVLEGGFREDLFFRLYIIPLHIPPLRERRSDIEPLAKHFTKLFSIDNQEIPISPRVMEQLFNHSWAGNVRELKNTLQRAVILSRGGSITTADIKLTELHPLGNAAIKALVSHEKERLIDALRRANGNQSRAANILGVARTTIANKIDKFEIDLSLIKQ